MSKTHPDRETTELRCGLTSLPGLQPCCGILGSTDMAASAPQPLVPASGAVVHQGA